MIAAGRRGTYPWNPVERDPSVLRSGTSEMLLVVMLYLDCSRSIGLPSLASTRRSWAVLEERGLVLGRTVVRVV